MRGILEIWTSLSNLQNVNCIIFKVSILIKDLFNGIIEITKGWCTFEKKTLDGTRLIVNIINVSCFFCSFISRR